MVIVEQILDQFSALFMGVDFWMIELIIISYLYYKLYKIPIYKHQILALTINLFPIIFKIITICLSFKGEYKFKGNNKYDNGHEGLKNLYVIYWYLLPIGILFYFIVIALRSYAIIEIKSFMDKKYLSENILLISYGFIGTLFYIIICIISTFLKCKKGNEDINIYNYLCNVKEPKTNNIYYDSFKLYFHTTNNTKEIIFEIIVEILAMLAFFFYQYFSILIIKYLSPAHLIFLFPSYYLIRKVILLIVSIIINMKKNKNIFDFNFNKMEYLKQKFIFNISGDIFSFIVFLIYLEIIELNFCKLNYNLRRNIILRSEEDLLGINKYYSSDEILDDENEE